MLVTIEGNLGSGKTLLLVMMGIISDKNLVYTNFDVDLERFGKNVKEFNLAILLVEKYNPSIVLIDEAYDYFESRLSMSIENILGSKLLFQSRKKGMDLYLTLQDFTSLDRRFRNLVNMRIKCEKFSDRKVFRYIFKTNRTKMIQLIPFSFAKRIYGLYNTYEVIHSDKSLELLSNYTSYEEKSKLITNNIDSFLDFMDEYNAKNPTNEIVKIYCRINKIPINPDFISLFKLEALKRVKGK